MANKSLLYGLKQADELFFKPMNRILTSIDTGMKCCIHDICAFALFDDEIVLLWVDDIIITGNSLSIVQRIVSCIESNVTNISNLGEITRFIGRDMIRDRINHTLELTQVPYTKSEIANLKATNVPLNPYHDYRAKNESEVNPPLHAELGSLRYLSD
jgi:hypothetical protein